MDDLRLECHRKLMALSRKILQQSRKHLNSLGFAWNQYLVMRSIQPGEALTLSEISSRSYKENSNITAIIDFLEEKGIVERNSDPADRRAIRVRLTPKGKEIRQKTVEEHEEFIKNLYPRLDNEDALEFLRILNVLNDQIRD